MVSVVLQNSDPVAEVDNVEEPQLFTTVMSGADGGVTGDAAPVPATLVQPFTVWVTEYVPAVTVMDDEVAPVLQRSEPVEAVDKMEVPQLSTTFTPGVEGV